MTNAEIRKMVVPCEIINKGDESYCKTEEVKSVFEAYAEIGVKVSFDYLGPTRVTRGRFVAGDHIMLLRKKGK